MTAFHINTVFGQNTFKAVIKDSETKEPLIRCDSYFIRTATGANADIDGLITLTNIPNGKQIIEFRYIGYETRKRHVWISVDNIKPDRDFLKSNADVSWTKLWFHLHEVQEQSKTFQQELNLLQERN